MHTYSPVQTKIYKYETSQNKKLDALMNFTNFIQKTVEKTFYSKDSTIVHAVYGTQINKKNNQTKINNNNKGK